MQQDYTVRLPDGRAVTVRGAPSEAAARQRVQEQFNLPPSQNATAPQEPASQSRTDRVMAAHPGLQGQDLGRMNDRDLMRAGVVPPPSFVSNGATLGAVDNILAATDGAGAFVGEMFNGQRDRSPGEAFGQTYRQSLDLMNEITDARRQARPIRSMALEAAGGLAFAGAPGAGVAAAPAAARSVVSPTLTQGALRLGGNVARGAATGAGFAGAYGFNEADGLGQNRLDAGLDSAKWGAAVGGALPLMTAGIGAVAGRLGNRRPPVPEVSELQQATRQAYQAVDDLGARYTPDAMGQLGDDIANAARADQINPARTPRAASLVDDIQQLRESPRSLVELDQWRQIARRDVASAPDASERYFGQMVIDRIDDFIAAARPSDMAAANADDAARAIMAARAANSTFRKAELIENAIESANLRAASTGSGGNAENTIRRNLGRLIEPNSRHARFFSAAEREAIEQVVRGTPTQNALRLIGKLSPSGNGLMAALGLGATVVNPAMAAFPAMGMAAKQAASAGINSSIDDITRLIRTGANVPTPGMNTAPIARSLFAPGGIAGGAARTTLEAQRQRLPARWSEPQTRPR